MVHFGKLFGCQAPTGWDHPPSLEMHIIHPSRSRRTTLESDALQSHQHHLPGSGSHSSSVLSPQLSTLSVPKEDARWQVRPPRRDSRSPSHHLRPVAARVVSPPPPRENQIRSLASQQAEREQPARPNVIARKQATRPLPLPNPGRARSAYVWVSS